jgi:hypothetical protein
VCTGHPEKQIIEKKDIISIIIQKVRRKKRRSLRGDTALVGTTQGYTVRWKIQTFASIAGLRANSGISPTGSQL